MKKMYALLLCLVMILTCAPAMADEPVALDMMLITTANYDHGNENWNRVIIEEIEKAVGVKLNITWISSEGAKEKVSTMIAGNNLPDIFSPGLSVESLVEEGAIMALDPYIDQIANYTRHLPASTEVAVRNVADGMLYQVNMLTQVSPAYAMVVRQDWLDNLGIETMPVTLDEWIEVWRKVRDEDANKNGDPNDEIPFVDPPTFTSGNPGMSLLMSFGIESNGLWYVQDGTYSLVYSHERFGEYLELMRMLYSEKLIDQEVFTNNATAVATLFNSNSAFSGYQWASRCANTTTTLAATIPEVMLVPTVPIKGEGQMIPTRTLQGSAFVFSYELESNPAKLEAALKLINFMYSDEGIELTNFGLEGVHHTVVDGKKVLLPELCSPACREARFAGLICQQFPTLWNYDNYVQMNTQNKPYEELSLADQLTYQGVTMYNDYYYTTPPSLSTPAVVEYSADIYAKLDELFANCVTGKITVEEFFKEYEALKPYGLQDILDQGQEYYDLLVK